MEESAWYGNDGFWTVMAPVMFSERRWAETETVCARVEALALARGLGPGGLLLDALCALGRTSLEFARRGWKVTGLDLCLPYLKAARDDARGRGLEIDFRHADIRALADESSFDLAVNLYNSFGYLESREDDLTMLRAIRGSLRPGGLLVMEFQGKELVHRDFRESEWYESGGDIVLLKSELREGGASLFQEWGLIKPDGRRYRFPFVQRLYDEAALRAALAEAGFVSVEVSGDLGGAPYGPRADSLVALARRPPS